jgi:ankyrin repeat protein
MTPLHWAMRNHHKQTAELLLSKGANPAITDAFGRVATACCDAG